MEDTSSSICNSYTGLAEVFRMTGGLLFRGLKINVSPGVRAFRATRALIVA